MTEFLSRPSPGSSDEWLEFSDGWFRPFSDEEREERRTRAELRWLNQAFHEPSEHVDNDYEQMQLDIRGFNQEELGDEI